MEINTYSLSASDEELVYLSLLYSIQTLISITPKKQEIQFIDLLPHQPWTSSQLLSDWLDNKSDPIIVNIHQNNSTDDNSKSEEIEDNNTNNKGYVIFKKKLIEDFLSTDIVYLIINVIKVMTTNLKM